MNDLKDIIKLLSEGKTLSEQQSEQAFSRIMSGQIDLPQMSAFVMAMRLRGETVDEITGGARVLRQKAAHVNVPDGAVDTCGTGGDGTGTYNISTAAAIVTAACGVPVAKHGNKSVSSKSGSADVLASLGIAMDMPLAAQEQALADFGIAFLFAPHHHKAMRHVGPVRASLGIRTIFNLLGPLANPAMAKRQLLGVFDREWLRPMAEVLARLGSEHVWVVHGSDGLDELTTTGPTYVCELKDGVFREFEVSPEDVGLKRATMADLQGGEADENAAALKDVLAGNPSAYRDIVLLNTGAALLVGNKVQTLKDGVIMAADAIDSGRAEALLAKWAAFTQQHAESKS